MPAATRVRIKGTRVYVEPVDVRSLDAAAGGHRWENARTIDNLNSTIFGGATTARRRAGYYSTNNPWARSGVNSLVSNLVGSGIKPQSQHRTSDVRETLHRLWLSWTDRADAGGLTDFYGLQMLAVRSMIEAGECFVRLRTVRGPAVPLQLELIDPEQVPMDLHRELAGGARIRAGIEFDAEGRRVAYHVYRQRPGEWTGGTPFETVRIPAADMIHLFEPLAPGQVRGLSWLAPILLRMHELDQFEDAHLVKAKVAAMFTAIMVDPDGSGSPLVSAVAGQVGMEPGSILPLPPGKDIRFSDPPDGGDFLPYVKTHLRAIAMGLGIPYETLSGDLEGVTYSSIRAGLVEFRRRCEQLQHAVVVFQLCRPVWERWVRLAMLAGVIPDGDLASYLAVKWLPPKFDYVNPKDDIEAEVLAINNRLKSRAQSIAEHGFDAETVDAEIAADQAREARLGIAHRQAPTSPSSQETQQ